MAHVGTGDHIVYLPSNGCKQYYPDNHASAFRNAIEPIKLNPHETYEVGVVNLLLPKLKQKKFHVQKHDPNYSITFEVTTLQDEVKIMHQFTPSRDLFGPTKIVLDELNRDLRDDYLNSITRRIEKTNIEGDLYDPRIDLVHVNFFKIIENRIAFFKNASWSEIYSPLEYAQLKKDLNTIMGNIKMNETFLPEWIEFTVDDQDDVDVFKSISIDSGMLLEKH